MRVRELRRVIQIWEPRAPCARSCTHSVTRNSSSRGALEWRPPFMQCAVPASATPPTLQQLPHPRVEGAASGA